jgi:hypothetical protein
MTTWHSADTPIAIPDAPGEWMDWSGPRWVGPAIYSEIVVSGVADEHTALATQQITAHITCDDWSQLHVWVELPGGGAWTVDLHALDPSPASDPFAAQFSAAVPLPAGMDINGTWKLYAQDMQGDTGHSTGTIDSWSIGYTIVGTDPDPVPDPFDPDAGAPADEAPACQTLLSLVQEFSHAVKCAVRITGPASIEMVNPNAPLPAGWYLEDADSMYADTTHALQAGGDDVSYAVDDLEMSAGATMVRNDVRLLVSSWQIPDQVPAYELGAAPVKRITHTFTPKDYTATVELHVPTVPPAARRP